jgi:hypothetical protein
MLSEMKHCLCSPGFEIIVIASLRIATKEIDSLLMRLQLHAVVFPIEFAAAELLLAV